MHVLLTEDNALIASGIVAGLEAQGFTVAHAATAAQATALANRAASLATNATPADRALIDALRLRYSDPAPADRKQLDAAYAQAMGKAAAPAANAPACTDPGPFVAPKS